MKSDKKDWILVGSSYFFSCYPEFTPKDQDWVELVKDPKEFKNVMQISGKFCLFRWRLMTPDEFVEYTLANDPAMMLGKFLVPEVCEKIGFGIEDLKKLEPVSLRLDPKHQYEKVIFDAYLENKKFELTPEQRLQAYEIYKKARNI